MSNPKVQFGSDDTYHLQRIIGNDRLDLTVGVTSSKTALTILDSGNVGIGSTNLSDKLHLYGTDSSTAGPHIRFQTNADAYPQMQILPWAHDSCFIGFDTYWDGSWKSSDVGSNYRIAKELDLFRFDYKSGISQGSDLVSWNLGLAMNNSGNVGIGTNNPSVKLHINQTNTASTAIFQSTATYGTVLEINSNATNGRSYKLQSTASGDGSNPLGGFVIDDVNAGARRFVIGSTGNIGIPNIDTNSKFVASSGDDLDTIYANNTGGGSGTRSSIRAKMNALSGSRNIFQGENLNGIVWKLDDLGAVSQYNSGASTLTNYLNPNGSSYISGGNVGIGTNNPIQKLDVNGGINIRNENLYVDWGFGIYIDQNNTWIQDAIMDVDFNNADRVVFYVPGAYGGNGASNPTSRMALNTTGLLIGDGVTAINHKLQVEGSGYINGNFRTAVTTLTTGTHSLNGTHSIIKADTSGGNITINLPAVSGYTGAEYKIIKTNASNSVTIDANASELIDGTTTNVVLTGLRDRVLLVCDGSEWHTF